MSSEQDSPSYWVIGPYQSGLPGPIRFCLELDGELVVRCKVQTGFLHRGLEKACELHAWDSVIPYVDHVDPEAAIFPELAYCLCVEELTQSPAPARAQAGRILLCELSRISAHIANMARLADIVELRTIYHFLLRDREKILDLFELITGARFSLRFLRPGGLAFDVTDGFIERVLDTCDLIQARLKEYNDLFTFNHSLLKRTSFVGVLPQALAQAAGVTGPCARASGLAFDVRRSHPYSGYDAVDVTVPVGTGEFGALGDCHDRVLTRLREISASIDIIKEVSARVPGGPFRIGDGGKIESISSGEAYCRVESPRGLLGCYLASTGKDRPARIQFCPPSFTLLEVFLKMVGGNYLSDVLIILNSLDLCVSEVDR